MFWYTFNTAFVTYCMFLLWDFDYYVKQPIVHGNNRAPWVIYSRKIPFIDDAIYRLKKKETRANFTY